MTVKASKRRLVELNDQIQAIQDLAEREDRQLTASEESEMRDLYGEFTLEDSRIQAQGHASRGRQADPQQPLPQNQLGGGSHRAHHAQDIFASATDDGGFKNFGEYAAALLGTLKGSSDRRLDYQASGLNEGTGAEGGFSVPSMFLGQILGPVFEESGILSRVSRIPMTGPSLAVGGFDTTDRSSGAIGGLELKWTGEGEQMTTQTAALKQLNLNAQKATCLVTASNEILLDSPVASQQLLEVFQMAAAYGLEKAVLTGDGVAKPQGVLGSDSIISVAKETASPSQTADTVAYENIVKMWSRMHPRCQQRSVWVVHPSVQAQLMLMAFDRNATTPVPPPAYPPYGQASTQPLLSPFSRPWIVSEVLPEVGDVGDIMCIDLSQYLFGVRLNATVDVSPHERFSYDETQFRLKLRVDGLPRWSSAVSLEAGDSLSWAVSLAERA